MSAPTDNTNAAAAVTLNEHARAEDAGRLEAGGTRGRLVIAF